MSNAKPTAAQAAALALIAKGVVYRWEHSGTWHIVVPTGPTFPKTTASSLVRRGWAEYGELKGIRRPLTLTDAGRALTPTAAEK